jgi:IclR family acetate operon transcriptional repressor
MRTAVWTDSVSVLDRVTAVLEAFGGDEGLGVSEIARRANLPKSTVSRIVTDLVRQRYLDREGSRLHLGLRLFELGQAVERPRRLRRLAQPVVIRLRDMTGESVRLAVLDGDDVVLIAAVAGTDDLRHPATVGVRFSAHSSALGKSILAHQPAESWPASPSPLDRELAEIRRTGVASDTDESAGVACVASAILVPGSPPIGAIAVSGSSRSVDARRMGGVVRAAAATLGRRFGQSQPP